MFDTKRKDSCNKNSKQKHSVNGKWNVFAFKNIKKFLAHHHY